MVHHQQNKKNLFEKIPQLTHLTIIHQIIEKEFMNVEADSLNEVEYKANLKKAFRVSNNSESVDQ